MQFYFQARKVAAELLSATRTKIEDCNIDEFLAD
jgi:hypothetical protein